MCNKNDNYRIMYVYFRLCQHEFIINILKGFSKGCGSGLDGIMTVFGDDPDENNLECETEFPEILGYDGVGFFSDYFPEPLFVSYQEFYNNLKRHTKDYILSKDDDFQKQAKYYLSLIRERYNLVDEGDDI